MKKDSLKIWDLMAEMYSKKPVEDEDAYQKELELTQKYFREDMEIFEFGSGTGSTAIVHAPHVKHILAIDGSVKMIEISKEKASKKNISNITFKQETIDAFTAPDNTYDVVLGLSILHLLKNKGEVIAKVYRMLKPGGIFVTNTMCVGDNRPLYKFLAPIAGLFGLVLRVFTQQELEESLIHAGFTIDYKWRPQKEGDAVFIILKK